MIPENELKEITRSHGVPSSTIERDYAQHWLLAYLPQMALKGGTRLNGPRSLKPWHLPDFHKKKNYVIILIFFLFNPQKSIRIDI